MKTGRSLNELAAEITRQNESKRDFIASTESVGVRTIDGPETIALEVGDKGTFPVGDIAHGQVAEHAGIPKVYYDRMRREAPDMLANNIERWFKRYPAPRLVRTLDNKARALLSDKFAMLDNFDLANAALPIIHDRKLDIVSCEVTERRLYIKVIDKQEFKIPTGYKMGDGSHKIFDVVAPALILCNSKVGFGRLVVETGTYTSACTNLAWFASGGFKRTHIGARHQMTEGFAVDDLDKIMSSQTKRKTMEALWLQVRDVVGSAFDEKVIARRVEQLTAANGNVIAGAKVQKVLDVTAERFGFNETEKGSVLEHLMAGGNLSQYGLHAAITRAAADVETYDRATDLEYVGGKVLELPASDWKVLAEAA